MKKLTILCVLGVIAAPALAQDTTQGVRIGLTYDRNGKPGVAVMQVTGQNADSVKAILQRDLDFSDRINVIPLDSGSNASGGLNYELFTKLSAVAVVQASITPAGALHVALHEVAQKRVISVMDIPLPNPAFSPEWRRVVHVIADSIEYSVLGQRGISSTRILFAGTRDGRIWSIDQDGGGLHAIPGSEAALSPAWSPSGGAIAYGAMRVGNAPPRIVVRDLATGKTVSHRVGGMNSQPAFSPNGQQLVFSSGNDGTDLYSVAPFSNDPPRPLTPRRGSQNSSPSFSPDGNRIAFMSDRVGHPEVYIMDADGLNPDILTSTGFGDRLYRADPSWSPNGRRVAYTSRVNDVNQIMTISVTDKSVTQLTSEGENEDPSWAPDGRHLVYTSTRGGSKQLWIIDTEGARSPRQLTHGSKVQNPAWSPRFDFKP
jgi:TolB protein